MVAEIIDPTASARCRVAAEGLTSPVLPRLAGMRVGLLENGKRNAAQVLDAVGAVLSARHTTGDIVRRTKKQFAMPLDEELLVDLRESCDLVVIGVGDCGSCSAAAVADGIALEALGLPTAVVCTEAFETTATAMAVLKGHAAYDFIVTEHPVANLSPDQIDARAEVLAERVVSRLLGRPEHQASVA